MDENDHKIAPNPDLTRETEAVLREWRTKILNGFLTVAAVAAAAGTVMTALDATSRPGQWSAVLLYFALWLVLAALAIFRKVDNRIRTWGVLLVAYAAGLITLATVGLGGTGRLYLLSIPIIALILLGVRAGIFTYAVSVLTMAVFALLAGYTRWLPLWISERNSLRLADWLAESGDTLMLMTIVMVLLILFYRFQERLIGKERRAQAELIRAQTLLEEQNVALEQKVKERTEELLQSNKIQTALYKLTDAASASSDMQEFFAQVHCIVGELMYAGNFFIALYDENTGLLSFPYFVDEQDEPFPTQPLEDFHGMTSYVIRTGNSIRHGWDQFNELMATHEVELAGSYNEDGIGAPLKADGKIIGAIFVQSYTKEIHYTDQDDEVLAYVAQHIATSLTRLRAIEDTRQRNSELQIINSIQEGLAAELDFQAIVELVGDNLCEIFSADTFGILLYDPKTDQTTFPYAVNRGERISLPATPPGGVSGYVLKSGETMVFNRNFDAESRKYDSDMLVEGEPPKSGIYVPIIAGNDTIGVVTAQNFEREDAYPDSTVRLLEIVAAHMGTALENARLFGETQHLLKETKQRNNELAILNSVGEAMAKTMDVKTMTCVVGDKVREIFDSDSSIIMLLDRQTNLIHVPYEFDRNEGGYIDYVEPFPLGTGLSSKVISSAQPLMLGTLEEEIANGAYFPPEIIEKGSGFYSQSWLGVPIIVSEQALGLIALSDAHTYAFNENHLRLLQTLANSMGAALENARLFAETQRLLKETEQRNAELAIINSVQVLLASKLDLHAIYESIGEKVCEVFMVQVVDIVIYDPATNLISMPYSYEKGDRSVISPREPYGFRLHVINTGTPLLINQNFVELASQYNNPLFTGEWPKSALFMPLLVNDKVKGIISIQDLDRENAFTASDVRLLETLANSISVALENARLFDETQRLLVETQQRTAELEIINRVGMALARQLDYEAIIAVVGERLREIFPEQMCSIALYNKATDTISWPYFASSVGQQIYQQPVPLGSGLTSHVIRSREPLVLGTLEEAEPYGVVWLYDDMEQEPRSWIGVPILVGEEAIGVLAVQDMPEYRYSENDVRLLATLAANIGVALENSRLFMEAGRRAGQMAALAEAGSEISASHDLLMIMEHITRRAHEVCKARTTVLRLVDPDRQSYRTRVALGMYAEQFQADAIRLGEGITGAILVSGVPEIIPDTDKDPRTLHVEGTPEEEEQPETLMVAPLVVRDQAVGVLTLYRWATEGQFTQVDLDFLSGLARQAAIAIENVSLLEETRSAREAAEAATQATSALLDEIRVVLDAIDYGILLMDPELRTRIVNRAFRELWGFPEEFIARAPTMAELINYNRDSGLYDVSSDEWDTYVERRVEAVQQGAIPPTSFRRRDGRILRYQALVLPGGGRMLTYFDITDLVHQNEYLAALHETTVGLISRLDVTEFLETLINRAGQLLNAPHGFLYLLEPGDTEMECKVGKGAPSQLVGSRIKPGEGLAGTIWQTGQPTFIQDYDAWPGRLKIIQPGQIRAIMGAPLKSGTQVVGVLGLAYGAESKRVFGTDEVGLLSRFAQLASVALDNARLYSAAQETQRRLTDIINFLPDATLVIDGEGRVIAWNRAIEEMTGITAEEMLGKGDYEYALPFYGERRPILVDLVFEPQESLEQKYSQIQRHGSILIGETYVPRLRGGARYLMGTASILRDSKDNIVGAIEIIRDITERKVAEDELQKAKEAAEAATQAKSAFLATMSHEIRTPMNAVIGMTSLLLDTPLTPEQSDYAETIRTSGDALLNIINDILDFSKIEAGRMELEWQPFDLRECVESAVDLLATRAVEKGLNLEYVVENNVPAAITGDVTRLRQILVNLIGNAVKFTNQGEVVLTVACDQGPASDGPVTCHFSIRDTGIGIPLDQQSRLFQSFSQVDASTTRRFGGTGLGLAISKRLAEMMGGEIWVESEGVPGKGSTFHFTIQAEVAEPLAPHPYLQNIHPRLDGKRVLIVDDNETNRYILSLQSQAWSMLPRNTGSPADALGWIRRGDPFDVALIDLQMPEMDGIELTTEIRRCRDADQLPVVMLSSFGQREMQASASALEGLDLAAYLLKPIKPSQLYNALVGIFGVEEASPDLEKAERIQFDVEFGKRHPLSILLAEDNAVNQKLALLMLERLGYRADVAGNGLEVLQALRRRRYDVVFMDVQMPEIDGLEATRAIVQKYGVKRRPRIVAMTANVMKEDRDECFAAGMDDFIPKPIQLAALVAALNRCPPRTVTELADTKHPAELPAPVASEAGIGPDLQPTAAAEPAPPVLDPAALQRLRSTLGQQADKMLPSLIDSFFKDAPRLIGDAQRFLEHGQPADLRRAAHSLKSTSATFGAMALSALARELEYKARDEALEGAEDLLRRIQSEYAQAQAALEKVRKE